MLNETQIKENYDRFIELINTEFEGVRKEKLIRMYDHFGDRVLLAPASSFEHFHNAFPGGYVDHVLRVYDNVLELVTLFANRGGIIDFTAEEVKFTALHHDLGKIGSFNKDCYLEQDSDWHRKNQGSMYKTNPEMQWMDYADRTFFVLQQFGIKYTETEFLTIKLTDGLYNDSAALYLKSFNKDKQLRSNLPYLMHWADNMAARIEWGAWRAEEEAEKVAVKQKYAKLLGEDDTKEAPKDVSDDFKDLFGKDLEEKTDSKGDLDTKIKDLFDKKEE